MITWPDCLWQHDYMTWLPVMTWLHDLIACDMITWPDCPWRHNYITWVIAYDTVIYNLILMKGSPTELITNKFHFFLLLSDRAVEYMDVSLALVYHTGTVMWIPQVILSSICNVESRNFPNDEHLCTLKVWVYIYNIANPELASFFRQILISQWSKDSNS